MKWTLIARADVNCTYSVKMYIAPDAFKLNQFFKSNFSHEVKWW